MLTNKIYKIKGEGGGWWVAKLLAYEELYAVDALVTTRASELASLCPMDRRKTARSGQRDSQWLLQHGDHCPVPVRRQVSWSTLTERTVARGAVTAPGDYQEWPR